MSKRIITVDPNLLNSSSSNTSRKSKTKYNKTRKADKPHNVNYEKLLGKIKEMKKNKLQQTKKKKIHVTPQIQPSVTLPEPIKPEINNEAIAVSLQTNNNTNLEITPETTFSKNTDPNSNIETPIIVETPQIALLPVAPPTAPLIAPPTAPPIATTPPIAPPIATAPLIAPPTATAPPTLPITIQPDPQYGILKNGKKPTRKNYMNCNAKTNTRFEKLRTIKRKYQLGKNGKKISVLLKDNKTRKKIKNEIQDLKQKSIKEVRTFLQEKNMIKAGSIAPNNVLRKMYEDMYLTGNIENKNSENLIHNYVNDEEFVN